MMKFFALVALAVFATANANTAPASITAARASVVAGAAGGDLTLVVTTTALIAAQGTITVTPSAAIFTQDGATTCTPTVVGGTPTFASSTVSDTAGTQLITFTLNAGNTDTVAAATAITIVCSDNLAVNALTNVAYTFTVATSGDLTPLAGQTGYTLTWTQAGWGSPGAARGTAATALMVGQAGGDLVFKFTPTTAIAADGTATFTASEALYTAADASTTCTTAVATGTAPTSTTTLASSGTGVTGNNVLVVTFAGNGVGAGVEATITCTANLADNGATAQAVTFGLVTSTDLNALATQTGYTLTAKTVTAFTAARATSVVTGVAGGDLTFTFKATTAIAADGTATITASQALYTAADASTTCATTVAGGGTAPTSTTTLASSGTGVTGNNVLVVTFAGHGVNAGSTATIVCSANLAVNGAAGAVTFGIKTDDSAGNALDAEATAQTGYTITAATSAASSTASVSMLTMLALAAVAMRQ